MNLRAIVAVVIVVCAASVIADMSCSDKAGNPCTWENSCTQCNRLAFSTLELHVVTGMVARTVLWRLALSLFGLLVPAPVLTSVPCVVAWCVVDTLADSAEHRDPLGLYVPGAHIEVRRC